MLPDLLITRRPNPLELPLAQPALAYLVIAALPFGLALDALTAIGRQRLSPRSHPSQEARP